MNAKWFESSHRHFELGAQDSSQKVTAEEGVDLIRAKWPYEPHMWMTIKQGNTFEHKCIDQGGAITLKNSLFLLHTPMILVSHLVSQTSNAFYSMWHTGVSSCCILRFPGVTSGLFPSATCDTNVTPGVTPRHWSMQQKATAFWPHGATYFVS